MILDYSNYKTQIESYGLNSGPRKKEGQNSLFFHKREYCQFCNKNIQCVETRNAIDTSTIEGVAWHKVHKVYACDCGWWEHTFYGYLEGEKEGFKDWSFEIDSAILKEFELATKSIPIGILRDYITKHPDKIYGIHHKKMEELVASVFKDHYHCETHVVGKTSDGGIDLILIESDNPIIVQVKRRTKSNKVEPVNQIRELIGATLLKDSKECIFVTTADHFSDEAIQAKNDALKKSIVKRFDLFDFDKFAGLLDLYKNNNVVFWDKLLKR